MKKQIAQGAEAKIILEDKSVAKLRFAKTYRIREIDDRLRGFRTRREAKILQKLSQAGFASPQIISSDDKEKIVMEKIEGKLVKEVFEKNFKKLSEDIGKNIAFLHNNGIIHGDLTTSNMILKSKDKKIYFIDFGLSFFSEKSEDKAVDLHVLKEAIDSKHYKVAKEAMGMILKSYSKEAKNSIETLKRLEAVEKRGRYRAKKGS